MRKRARQAGGGSHDIAGAEVMVRRSSIAACITCGLCGRLLRNATAISECLHAFCRECIVDEFNHKNTRNCPKCGIDLGCDPLEKLRPDHNLECIALVIFPSKRCKFEEISLEPALGDHSEAENLVLREELENERAGKTDALEKSTVLEGAALAPVPSSKTQDNEVEVEVEVVDETLISHGLKHEFYILDLAPVGRDTLARIRCRDFYFASSLSAESGALIVWQSPSVPRGISYDQTAPKQSQLTTAAPVHSHVSVGADRTERQANSPSSVPLATTLLVASGPSHVRTSVQYDELRSEILSICNDNSERILQRIDAHIRQNQVYKEVARLEEELESARLGKSAASERARVLEQKLQDHTEWSQDIEAAQRELLQENRTLKSDILGKNEELISLKHNNNMIQNRILEAEQKNTVLENRMNHLSKLLEAEKLNSRKLNEQLWKAVNKSEFEQYRKNEAARRELLREHIILKSELAKKAEELTNLKHDFLMIENRNIEVEKKNTVLEERIDHVNRLLGEENLNSRKRNEQLWEAINEKNKLMAELAICNDAPGRIQGAIRGILNATISDLKSTKAITKSVHYEDLLSRMDDLEEVQGHLPKIWGTIKIATSLSAYGAVSVVFARLRAYHGDDFDIQRLLLPVQHLSDEHCARIRNAVEPLAAEVAQKYGLKYVDS